MSSDSSKPSNACHVCGATSYRHVLKRNADGQMKPTGQLQCIGCARLFADVKEWRSPPLPSATGASS